jgi:hypothetical protein
MLRMFVVKVRCSFGVVIRVLNTQSRSKQFQTQWHILYKTVMVSAATATATATATAAATITVVAAVQYLNQYLQCITFHQKLPQYPVDPASDSRTGVHKKLKNYTSSRHTNMFCV